MKKKTTLAIALIIFQLFCISCSGNNNSKNGNIKLTRIEFLFDWKIVSVYSPYILASQEGFFKDNGLEVVFIEGQGAETSAKLIGEGKYSIGTCNAAATFPLSQVA